jgi:hypothetical protein
MPTGSFSLTSLPPSRSSYAVPILVCTYDGSGNMTPLPNVVCIRIDERSGPYPPVAQFAYQLDDNLAFSLGWPSQVEQIWPIDAPSNPYVIENDDRIVVLTQSQAGVTSCLFDGFAQIPQTDVSADSQNITFTAINVACREWDRPLRGRFQRNANTPTADPDTGPVDVDMPCRFNPSDTTAADGGKGGIIPNCTPDNADVNQDDPSSSYPVFLDQDIKGIPAVVGPPAVAAVPPPQTRWTVSKVCRYAMGIGNPREVYVQNPDFSELTSLLQSYAPPDGSDISNLASDTTADVTVRDYDGSDKAWPDCLNELLSYSGFSFRFFTFLSSSGFPSTVVKIYRNDALTTIAPKQLFLQPSGGVLGVSPNNVTAFHLARDCNNIVNQYSIESPLKHVEASFLLAPLYVPDPGGAVDGPTGRGEFIKSSFTPATTGIVRRAYRWYGVDEIGEGHWNMDSQAFATDAYDFGARVTGIFPPTDAGKPLYVKRYRPGSGTLISVDSRGIALKAQLAVSFNSLQLPPTTWDGTGDWFPIDGGWKLLDDRLGIEVTLDDPEQFDVNKLVGKIGGVTMWADPVKYVVGPSFGGKSVNVGVVPILRLTTVVEDDRMMSVKAAKRSASPTQFIRRRRVDCRDHFQFNRVVATSLYNQTNFDVIARNDTALAQSHANSLRAKTEFPPVAGSVTLPFFTAYYQVGDRFSEIDGRNINLQMNAGASQSEAPDYPFAVGKSWTFQPRQETTLQLGDHRAEAVNI